MLIAVLASILVAGAVGPHLAARASLSHEHSATCDSAVGIVSGLAAQPGHGYRKPLSLLEPSLFATAWNAQTLRETTSFALTPELEAFARRVVKERKAGNDVASRLEAIDAAVGILGDSLTASDRKRVIGEIELLRAEDSYRVSESSETSPYATLIASHVLARLDHPLPAAVSEPLVSGLSNLRRSFSLAEIDKTGIPTLLPLMLGRQKLLPRSSHGEASALINAWDETISRDPVNGMTLAMRVWLREARADVRLDSSPDELEGLKASDGGFALSPGSTFDPKATFLAVAMGARLTERDLDRVRRGMATPGWLHVGEPDLHSTYLAAEIDARCGRESADSTALIEEITANGLDDVRIQDLFELCSLTHGEDDVRTLLGSTISTLATLAPSSLSESSQLAVTAQACDIEVVGPFPVTRTGQPNSLHALQEAALGNITKRRTLIADSKNTLASLKTRSGWSFAGGEETDALSTFIGRAIDPSHASHDRDAHRGLNHAPDLAVLLASLSSPGDLTPLHQLAFLG